MKLNTVTNRYILIELLPPFFINVGFLLFIFLMTKILDITNYIVNYKIGMMVVLSMLLFTMPQFLQFVIPMSVMLAVLLTFMRMAGDNEIIALKASGLSIYQLLPPVALFCMVGTLLTMLLTIYGIPWGNLSLRLLTTRVAASSFEIGLKERTFNDNFKDVMLYVSKIDGRNKELLDVFIEDKRNEEMVSTIVSSRGKLLSDPENLAFRLRLWDGTINQVNIQNRSVNSIQFDTYDVRLSIKELVQGSGNRRKRRSEMSLAEMREYISTSEKKDKAYNKMVMDLHRKFSIPLASVVLGLIAVPLGIQSEVRKRSPGLAFGLALFLIYYVLLTVGEAFGEIGKVPPFLGMWAPNLGMGTIAAIFIYRAGRERSLMGTALAGAAGRLIDTLVRRVKRKSEAG
jgi:lipopolysaccharide export system permease protein